ncbi:MAG: DUF1501 domain-containing protein [Bdellovibrionales bacterium]|nr:DUF1501 domain-containing protein [Bdellovibrionales bacterium]
MASSQRRNVSRRKFLKVLSQTGGAAAIGAFAQPNFLMAQSSGTSDPWNVVLVNLLGGLDGLAAFPLYAGSRAATVAQARPSLAINPEQVLSIDSQTGIENKIGLHPSFAPLVNVAGSRMKIVQGYGILDDIGRSHDTCQVAMSLGRNDVNDPEMKGFLARLMDSQDWDTLQYFAFDVVNPSDVNTSKNSPVKLSDLGNFNHRGTWWEDDAQVAQAAAMKKALLSLQSQTGGLAERYMAESTLMYDTVQLVQSSIANQVVGNNSAGDYSGDWGIGVQLRGISQILKAKMTNPDLSFSREHQIFYARQDGYDTHSDQANSSLPDNGIAARLQELASNLAVFYRDLELYGALERTIVVLYSEFGRTCFQNAPANRPAAGTDHGWGSNTLVFGGGVTPGVIGSAPLASDFTDPWFNALTPTIDYRDIFAEIFQQTMGISPSLIFPNSYSHTRYGIVSV